MNHWILFFFIYLVFVTHASTNRYNVTLENNKNLCDLLVLAHRGASGYIPEHTLGAYALAIIMGADYIEPDLVMTSDGHLVALHDNELSLTTDVAEHPEFLERRCNKTVDTIELTGWFSEDFTLAELKTLRAVERIPQLRPGNARMNGIFTIPTFQEIIDLVKSLQLSVKQTIGICPEIKHSTYFQRLGLSMELPVIHTLLRNDYWRSTDPVYIQSFEITNLKYLKNKTDLRLLQLLKDQHKQPFDQYEAGTGIFYGDMATPNGLRNVAKYATAVGPNKTYIIPTDEINRLGEKSSFVSDAHAEGLKVIPYAFRKENFFLASEFWSQNESPGDSGDMKSEILAYVSTGIDGLFSDYPEILADMRGPC